MRRVLGIAVGVVALATAVVPAAAPAAQPAAQPAPHSITLINAYDAFGRQVPGLRQDFGFSTVLRHGGKTILFDAGTDQATFLANLDALDIPLASIDIAVLSHGHSDHTAGLGALLAANPGVRLYLPNDFSSLGAPITFPFRDADPGVAETLSADERYFRGRQGTDGMRTVPTGRFVGRNVQYVTAATEILPGLTVVPTAAELMGTFMRYPPHGEDPLLVGMPELSLAIDTPRGQVILVGCSHASVEAIVRATLAVRPRPILMVAGGFHLIPYGRAEVTALALRLRDIHGVRLVAPAHCTGHLAFAVLKQVFGPGYRFFGLGETLEI